MHRDGGEQADYSTSVLEAAAVVVPILAIVALVLLLGRQDEGAATVVTASTPVAETARSATTGLADPSSIGAAGGASAPVGQTAETGIGSAAGVDQQRASKTEISRAPRVGGPIVWVRGGERIKVLDAPGGEVVASQGDETEFGSPSVFSVRRQTADWVGISTPALPNGELGWIRDDPGELRSGFVDYSIVVDLSERSARLFHDQVQVRSWPVTVGAPESETPTGKFAVTDEFRGGLNAAYGCCAVALSATQPNLPANWPGGDRIAFHGTDGPLGVAASNGCLRSTDEDVSALLDTVPLGTPATIRR